MRSSLKHLWAGIGLVLTGPLAVAFGEAASTNGLIGHWPLDEGQGYVLRDRAGQVGDGEQVGAAWAPCGTGWCLRLGEPFKAGLDLGRPASPLFSLRGADADGFSYARLPLKRLCLLGHQGALRAMAVSLWLKPLRGGAADPAQGGRANVFFGGNFLVGISAEGTNWSGTLHSGDKRVQIPGPPVRDAWTHVALMHDEVFARFFVNGREAGPDGPYLATNVRFPVSEKKGAFGMFLSALGLGGRGQAFPYAGCVADLRLYNRLLADAEIEALVREGPCGRGPVSAAADTMTPAFPLVERGVR